MFKKSIGSLVAIGSAVVATAANAQAAATTAFTGAITSVSADIATYGGALIAVAVIGVGFMVGMKYVKKIRGAA